MAIGDKNKVSDDFWMNLVAEKIYDAFNARAKAVDSIQTFVKWVFGLFSSGSFLLIFFGRDNLSQCTLIVWAVGIALLLPGASLSMESGFPKLKGTDPEDAESIEAGYAGAVESSNRLFRVSFYLIMGGIFALSLGIILEFGWAKRAATQSRLQINAYVDKRAGGTLLPYVIRGEKNGSVNLVISGTDSTLAGQPYLLKDTVLMNRFFPTDTAGLCVGTYVLPEGLKWKYVRMTAASRHNADPDSLYDMVAKKILIVQEQ